MKPQELRRESAKLAVSTVVAEDGQVFLRLEAHAQATAGLLFNEGLALYLMVRPGIGKVEVAALTHALNIACDGVLGVLTDRHHLFPFFASPKDIH